MLEPFLRANFSRLHRLYDRFPAPARTLLTSARGWSLTRLRYTAATFAFLDQLRSHEAWSPAEVAAFQLRALQESVKHARETADYYSGYPRFQIRSFDDLRRFPILHREALRQQRDQFLSRATPPHARIVAGTTGTTGGNVKVAYTEELARENWAFLLRQWAWAGIPPLQPRVTLFGARIVPPSRVKPPYWTFNLPERQILLSIFHLSEKTAADYLGLLRRQQGAILEGFPSALSILADFVRSRGETIPMRVVFTSGEPLYPEAREKIGAAFQSSVFDSYGMTEYCGLIQQCERGEMHLAPEYGFLEILDEGGEPVQGEDEGYFVWTGFLNRAMPLIRYRIGDRGKWKLEGPCACGRAFPRVIPTITRESEILRCSDGRIFSPRALNQFLKQSASLRFCQFIHDQSEHLVVRAVAGAQSAPEVMRIRADLQRLLGSSMRVTAEMASEPVSLPGGKIPLIINRISP